MGRILVPVALTLAVSGLVGTTAMVRPTARPARPRVAEMATVVRPTAPNANPVAHAPRTRELLYHLKHGSNRKRRAVLLELMERPDPTTMAALIACLSHQDDWWGRVRYELEQALGAIGPDAIPALVDLLKHPDVRARVSAANALAWMGPEAAPAARALKAALADEKIWSAGRALGSIGEAAVPLLVEALVEDALTAGVCAGFKTLGKTGAPALADALSHPDGDVRSSASEMLSRLGRNARDVLPQILDALRGSLIVDHFELMGLVARLEPGVESIPDLLAIGSARAILIVGSMGPSARGALPALRDSLGSDDLEVASAAAAALWKVTGDADEAIDRLREIYEIDPRTAIHGLSRLGKQAAPALPLLTGELRSNDLSRSFHATLALIRIGDVDAVREALSGLSEDRWGAAQRIAWSWNTKAKPLLPELERLHPGTDFRRVRGVPAADVLPQILEAIYGEDFEEVHKGLRALRAGHTRAVPRLRQFLKKKRHLERALGAVRRIGPGAEAAVPELVALLGGEKWRGHAAEALGGIGPAAGGAVATLSTHVDDERAGVRGKVLLALWSITGQRAHLIAAHRDAHWVVRRAAVRVMGKTGPWSVRLLVEALRDPELDVQRAATQALGKLGPAAQSAETSLRIIADDPRLDENLRYDARKALAEVLR